MDYMKLNEVYEVAAEQRKKFAIECIAAYMDMMDAEDHQQKMVAERLRNLYSMYDQAMDNVVAATESLTEGAEQIQHILKIYEES